MATSEALIKYYDCLKDSFNKIQDKDNKTALINAALRPKIREEFEKSDKVLISYLNYIQVFSLIYSDKFAQICNNIIVPLFKENDLNLIQNNIINNNDGESENKNDKAAKLHETIRTIIKSRPELEDEFVSCVVRVFPGINNQTNPGESFKVFLNNCLEICTYLDNENLTILISKIFDKLNPPKVNSLEPDELDQIKITLFDSYELIYKHINKLERDDDRAKLETFVTTITNVFVRDFVSSPIEDHFKYLLIYIHSSDIKYSNLFIELLWGTFLDQKRPIKDRRASVAFASSFISRANYITLEQLLEYLDRACKWCIETVKQYKFNDKSNQSFGVDVESSFYTLSHSIFYIITQRYREMYEKETIDKLLNLKLDRIIDSPLTPLEVCDSEIEERFREVSSLYRIADLNSVKDNKTSSTLKGSKRQKSENYTTKLIWKPAYREDGLFVPDKIKPLYRTYYHHKFFTISRDE